MITVSSTFANTDVLPANSHGPYVINGGSPVTLSAGAPNSNASYEWDLGDGATATTPTVVHTYGDDGIYIAKLKVTVNEPGGAVSRHFAIIQAKNVPATVSVGPNRTVNEGDNVSFEGTFSDPQWLETHSAMWDWGDSQKPDVGVVAETHNPPAAQGTVTGSHAWGDSGSYPVTLSVMGDGGAVGRAQATVTVLNVPPKVEAGRSLFAYPCTVLTLEGRFTDPGWLDAHAGFWDFGDGTGLQRAVVRETNKPPAAKGAVIASHIYRECGDYEALCTVIDDDGGVGKGARTIKVVDIRNRHFEHGFHVRQSGGVANHWEPYFAKVPTLSSAQDLNPLIVSATSGSDVFLPEEYYVHSGERSQRIRFSGKSRAGILQRVGANPDWDYQISIWYSLSEQAGGVSELIRDVDDPADMSAPVGGIARLGIDPKGGTDPSAQSIVWSEGYIRQHWAQLTVRGVAQADAVTAFLEGQGSGRLTFDVCFDDASLVAVQPFCVPSKGSDVCVDFSGLKAGLMVPAVYVRDGFAFAALDKQPQLITSSGQPAGENKLQLRPRGLEIDFPFQADAARITVGNVAAVPVGITAYDSQGQVAGNATTSAGQAVQTIQILASGMTNLRVLGKEESLLVKVCIHPQPGQKSPNQAGENENSTLGKASNAVGGR